MNTYANTSPGGDRTNASRFAPRASVAAFALLLSATTACFPFFETDCVPNDPYCRPDAGWLLYQQILKPNIPLFQTVSGQGLVARSFDGNDWTKTVSENSITTQALFGGVATDQLGNWVATGAGGEIMLSSDSETWRLATGTGVSAAVLRGVSYSAALDRWLTPASGTEIFSSTDRDNWSNAAAPVGPTPYYNSAAGPDQFVAVGNSGGIYRSVDGSNWVAAASNGVPTGILWSVHYSTEQAQWLLVGVTGQIYRSTDGNTWAAAASSGFTANDLRGVRYGGGTYVAVGDNSTIARSTDGDTWTLATGSGIFGTTTLTAVDYSPLLGVWVAVGNNGIIARSFDGDEWSIAATSGFTPLSLFGVAAGVIPVANP